MYLEFKLKIEQLELQLAEAREWAASRHRRITTLPCSTGAWCGRPETSQSCSLPKQKCDTRPAERLGNQRATL